MQLEMYLIHQIDVKADSVRTMPNSSLYKVPI